MKISSTTNLSNDSVLQSKVIDFLRFPLIVGVLFIHNAATTISFSGEELGNNSYMPLHHFFENLFSQTLGRVAVPLFFFISGFLFFLNVNFNRQCYLKKLTGRLKTLLIPYLFWNIFSMCIFYLAYRLPFLSTWFSESHEISIGYIIKNLWACPSETSMTYPYAYQFWFIRDLMVVVLLTLVLYLYTKTFKFFGIILFGVLWFFHWWFPFIGTHGLNIAALFFFSAGAWFSINQKNIIVELRKVQQFSFILYPLLVVIDLLTKKYDFNLFVHNIGILVGIVFWFNLAALLLRTGKMKTNGFLAAASFFVFAVHDPILLSKFRKIVFVVLKPSSDIEITLLYFVNVIIVTGIALLLYYLLRKFLPRFTKIITGGR
jgi:surface polysaccharide O-acyltransferase-like enzyme